MAEPELSETISILQNCIKKINEDPQFAKEIFNDPEILSSCLTDITHILKLIDDRR